LFNLLVKFSAWGEGQDSISYGRLFEYTEKYLQNRFEVDGQIDFNSLVTFPTLFMQETSGAGDQVARVGTITRAKLSGGNIVLEYAYDLGVPSIPNAVLRTFATKLGIADVEFGRTHWAVKDTDLFRTLLRVTQPHRQRPSVFQIPEHENIEDSLISAMMPFDPRFDAVYATLKQVAESIRLRCRRADDIWENPAVIQDVVSLIDRSRVVICDCSGRNPNVFYEIGIAHTLGRDVILITQSESDIPFDLRHLRYINYLNNGEGLAALSARLTPRLIDLAGM
jgi:hypothetical protein